MINTLKNQIEVAIGKYPTHIKALSGGMIGQVYQIELPNNETIVAKYAPNTDATLDIEGYMLNYLKQHSNIPVPDVIHNSKQLLLMTFIEGNSNLSTSVQEHAAELLAGLHNIRAKSFGLERDTLIGGLHQPNPNSDSWLTFFRDHRLLFMGKHALKEGQLTSSLYSRLENFCADLGKWLNEPKHPALLHGDMWTTNILAKNGRVTGFVDPAIYYGHPEIELAFSTLFGTFNQAFFDLYHEINPIEPEFMQVRRDIYNLYPLLVHVRLFGGGYSNSVSSILKGFGY